jgi:hypothetical protein
MLSPVRQHFYFNRIIKAGKLNFPALFQRKSDDFNKIEIPDYSEFQTK